MLECKGVVKELPQPAEGKEWKIMFSQGTNIPFITDGTTRHWCMSLFQQSDSSGPKSVSEKMPNLDLDTIVATDEPSAQVPVAPMTGQKPGALGENNYPYQHSELLLS